MVTKITQFLGFFEIHPEAPCGFIFCSRFYFFGLPEKFGFCCFFTVAMHSSFALFILNKIEKFYSNFIAGIRSKSQATQLIWFFSQELTKTFSSYGKNDLFKHVVPAICIGEFLQCYLLLFRFCFPFSFHLLFFFRTRFDSFIPK